MAHTRGSEPNIGVGSAVLLGTSQDAFKLAVSLLMANDLLGEIGISPDIRYPPVLPTVGPSICLQLRQASTRGWATASAQGQLLSVLQPPLFGHCLWLTNWKVSM